MSLDNVVRNNVLDALNGVAAFSAPTTPIKVRLMTTNGSATVNGTQLATGAGSGSGAGYTAGGQAVTFNAAGTDGQTEPTATVRWDNMPVCTIVGAELWDSAGTPKRIQFGALTAPKTLASGDAFELPVADFSETLT
jgi:hypothetical protein